MTTQHLQEADSVSPSSPVASHCSSNPLPSNESLRSSPIETPSTSGSNASNPRLLSPRTDFFLDWALKVLGVGAAVLFGIWAPISYKATTDGNNDNDASQGKILKQLSALRAQASSAAAMQGSAAVALAEVQERLNDLGILRAWEFCEGRTNRIHACESFNSTWKVNSVVSQLLGHTSTAYADPTRTASASPLPGGKVTASLFPVILGALLGGVALVLLMFAGLFLLVWARRFRNGHGKGRESH